MDGIPSRVGEICVAMRGSQAFGVSLQVARSFLFSGAMLALAASAEASPTGSDSFVDDFTTFDHDRWLVSDGWSNGDWQNCTWSKRQLELGAGTLTLSFVKRREKDRDYACAEIQTRQRYSYGVYEARLKADEGSGLNAAFFTYIGPVHGEPHDEIDFEVLARDPSKVSLNTYVSGEPRNGSVADVPDGADTRFVDYAFVWEPDRLRWYVDGKLVHTAAGPGLPTHAQKIYFSLWGSDTFTDWLGAFKDPGRNVTMEVDRIAYTALGQPCQFADSIACDLKE